MQPRIKLWLEADDGRLVLSDYRARLLRLVRETGSLARAASAMQLSYRRAWGKIREIEVNLGQSLVQSEVGGVGGGSTRLTEEGVRLLDAYERFSQDVGMAVERLFVDRFAATTASIQGAEQFEAVADDAVDAPANQP